MDNMEAVEEEVIVRETAVAVGILWVPKSSETEARGKRTRGSLRASREPPYSWGLGALSFEPKVLSGPEPAGPRAPQNPKPGAMGCRGPWAFSFTPPEGPQDSWGPPRTGGRTGDSYSMK